MVFDAVANQVTAFSFTVAGLPTSPGTRVNAEFPTTDTVAMGQDSYQYELLSNGEVTVQMATTGTGNVLAEAFTPSGFTQPAFDAAHLLAVQFHVVTNVSNAIDVTKLCISDFAAITCP
jgi:hypothetical protein